MCLRSSFERFAIPCMYEIEGIITMPVSILSVTQYWSSNSCTDWHRYLVVAAPPAWSVETLFGSFPANAARNVAHRSIRLAIHVRYA